jgi:hypothetical protein
MSAQDYYGGGGGGYPQQPQPVCYPGAIAQTQSQLLTVLFYSPTALPKDNTDLPKASTDLLKDNTPPRKVNITARLKANPLCNTNKHLLNKVVERVAAAVAWQVVWLLCAAAALLKKDVNAGKLSTIVIGVISAVG